MLGGGIILLILCKIFQFLLVWRLRGIFISFHCGDFLWSTGMLISCSVLALWGHSREKLSYFTCKLPWGFSCNCNRWQPKRCSWKSTNKSQCRRWRTRQTSYCCHRLASCRNNGEIIKVYTVFYQKFTKLTARHMGPNGHLSIIYSPVKDLRNTI